MKLHLPLSLRLLLALSVAAIAAAPSYAEITTWDVSTWEGASADGSFTVGNTGSGDPVLKHIALDPRQSWNTEWSVMLSAKGSDLTGDLSLIGLCLSSTANTTGASGVVAGATMSSGNLNLTTWGAALSGQSSGIDFSSYENVTFVMSRNSDGYLSLTAYDSSDFSSSLFTCSQEAQSFGKYFLSGFVFGGIGTADTPGIPSKFTAGANHVTFADNSAVGSYSLTKVGFLSGSVAAESDLTSYYYSGTTHATLTWNGGASGNWSEASWDNGTAENASFGTYDSVIFATEGATVTVDTRASANELSVNADTTFALERYLSATSMTVAEGKKLTLSGAGTVETSSLSGGAVDISGLTVTVSGAISDTILTVTDGSTVTAQSLTGTSANVSGSTLTVSGAISGTNDTTLTVTNGGTVTADSLAGVTATVEAATDTAQGSTLALAGAGLGAVGRDTVVNGALTLTGGGRVTVAGNVTLGSVVNNLTAGGSDTYAFEGVRRDLGNVTLKFAKGVTDLTGNNRSRIGFDNNGTIIVGAEASVKTSLVYNSSTLDRNAAVIVEKGGTLEMSASGTNKMLSLNNQGKVTAAGNLEINGNSTYGGKVDVGGSLTYKAGTHEISGEVSANTVALVSGGTAVLQGDGTLTIKGIGASGHSSGPSLAGNLTVVKEGASGYIQNFGAEKNNRNVALGDNSRFTGSLVVKSGIMNLAEFGQTTRVNLKDISISNGSTLRLYAESLSSNDESYKANVSVNTLTVGEGGGSLAANLALSSSSRLTMDGTLTMDGSLTLNQTLLSGALLDSLSAKGDKVTLVDGLAWSSLTIGNGVSTLAATDEAGQWLTDTDGSSYYQFTSADLEAAFGNLNSDAYEIRFYGTEAGASGSLAMVYIPEPTSATLSLLALAGLCARRRRR